MDSAGHELRPARVAERRPHDASRAMAVRVDGQTAFRLLALALLVVLTVWSFAAPVTQLDDAFISYRYAHNLVAGHGLVFNPGEYVEGYTNLLWTLMIAGGMALGGEGEALGHWFSVVFAAASMVATYAYTAGLLPRKLRSFALLAPVGLLASNAFVSWVTAGLETPLVIFLALVCAVAFQRGHRYTGALFCFLAFMTRPDGVLLAAAFIGWDMLARVRTAGAQQTPAWWRDLCGPAALFSALALCLEAFRVSYYGDLVPNTFYAKVGGIPLSQGLIYLRNFFVDGPALLLPGAVIAAWRLPSYRPVVPFVVLTVLYVGAIGGDVFPLGRFCVPILPFLLAGAVAAGCVVLPLKRIGGVALLAALPAFVGWTLYGPWSFWTPPDYDFVRAVPASFPHSAKRHAARIHWIFTADEDEAKHVQLARLRAYKPAPHLLALIGIGKLGYWGSEFRIIDMLGLTDRHIAHSTKTFPNTYIAPGHDRTDSDYVFSKHPDMIELPPKGSLIVRHPVIVDFWSNPRLNQSYHYVPGLAMYAHN